VLIVITADPDSIASAVALKRLLWRRAAHVQICATNEVRRPDNLRLLKSLGLPLPLLSSEDTSRYTRLAMVDGQPGHCAQTEGLGFSLVVDHHPARERAAGAPAPAYEDIRPEMGATSTIFADYLRAARIRPNRRLATALFYGIKTDTQNFVRRGQLEDMRAFQWLYPFIHQPLLSDIERAPVDRSAFEVIKRALTLMSFRKQYAFVFVEELDHADTLVIVADFVMQIEGVSRAVISGVFEDRLVVVLRSAGLRSNLGELAARAFGEFGAAGGHKNMARAEMRLADLDPRLPGKPQSLARFVLRRLGEALGHPRRRRPAAREGGDAEADGGEGGRRVRGLLALHPVKTAAPPESGGKAGARSRPAQAAAGKGRETAAEAGRGSAGGKGREAAAEKGRGAAGGKGARAPSD
jgi:nanoRNase/pAp phosphatase (c-di-AMP/oligoRNAs hydrolase)